MFIYLFTLIYSFIHLVYALPLGLPLTQSLAPVTHLLLLLEDLPRVSPTLVHQVFAGLHISSFTETRQGNQVRETYFTALGIHATLPVGRPTWRPNYTFATYVWGGLGPAHSNIFGWWFSLWEPTGSRLVDPAGFPGSSYPLPGPQSFAQLFHKILVMAVPGCQLDYMWNELQFRIEGYTCDPDLEAGRYKFLIWILAWRSWGIVAMKSLGPRKVVHAFNPRELRQGDLQVPGQPRTKQVPDPGVVAYSFNLGYTFCWRPT